MKVSVATLSVSYAQIAVHQSGVDAPFNYWTDAHFAQGFAWRNESVGFRTLDEFGEHEVRIEVVERFADTEPWIRRAIDVPFRVSESGEVVVASIEDECSIAVAPALYQLRFELGTATSGKPLIRLQFLSCDDPGFAIVRADSEIEIPAIWPPEAEPA